ncbi:MAG: hypothetical protein B6244_01350 [Candidatus Cloacimonetes bacterium 4572_55]|nr:MAG: hypothetical protein B6244_01350 [Candidatus Cloacimonetes bacterium 4572_55]
MWMKRNFSALAPLILLLTTTAISADKNNPYRLTAPNGGVMVESHQGSYALHVRQPVKIVHGDMTMTGDDGWLYQQEEKAVLKGNVVIQDRDKTLYADQVIYLKRDRRTMLEGNVLIHDFEREMRGNQAVYWRDQKRIEATGNVSLYDYKQKLTLHAQRGVYNGETGLAEFDEYPEFILHDARQSDDGGQQPITVQADLMQYFSDSEKVIALGDVSIHHQDALAYCGQAIFSRKSDEIYMIHEPVIGYQDSTTQSQAQGDTIFAIMEKDKLRQIAILGNAVVAHYSLSDTSDSVNGLSDKRPNLATGDVIRMYIRQNRVQRMIISGNARSVYFPVDKSTQSQERNDVSGARIGFEMNRGKIKEVSVAGACKGRYFFPEKETK